MHLWFGTHSTSKDKGRLLSLCWPVRTTFFPPPFLSPWSCLRWCRRQLWSKEMHDNGSVRASSRTLIFPVTVPNVAEMNVISLQRSRLHARVGSCCRAPAGKNKEISWDCQKSGLIGMAEMTGIWREVDLPVSKAVSQYAFLQACEASSITEFFSNFNYPIFLLCCKFLGRLLAPPMIKYASAVTWARGSEVSNNAFYLGHCSKGVGTQTWTSKYVLVEFMT